MGVALFVRKGGQGVGFKVLGSFPWKKVKFIEMNGNLLSFQITLHVIP